MTDILGFERSNLRSKIITIEELYSLKEIEVGVIYIDPILQVEKNRFLFATKEHPLSIGNNTPIMGNYFGIEKEYYLNNKEEIDKLINYICLNTKSKSFRLPIDIITKQTIESISNNPNIETVSLGSKDHPYTLTNEDYQILIKNPHIKAIHTEKVDEVLEDNFDERIAYNKYREILKTYTISRLKTSNEITLEGELTEKEFNRLQYINKDAYVIIKRNHNYEQVFKILNYLNNNGNHKLEIKIQYENEFNDKNEFNIYVLQHPEVIETPNLQIGVGILEKYSLKDYITYEKRLIELIKPALNLSPLEKYLYAYNIVKKYKQYKESNNPNEARNLYSILDGEYMVCVGYSTMLVDLLNKLGIDAMKISQEVDITYDNQPLDIEVIPEDLDSARAGHARIAVNLVDPKYNIDGIYYADPTWDNDLQNDTYNYCLLSQTEYVGIRRTNYTSFTYIVDELFFSSSLEEFYTKANIWLDRRAKTNYLDDRKIYLEKTKEFKELFVDFMNTLKKVDKKNYEYYNNIYKNIYTMNIMSSNTKRFITRIKNVVKQNNNPELNDKYNKLESSYRTAIYYTNNEQKDENYSRIILIKDIFKIIRVLDPSKYEELTIYNEIFDVNYNISDNMFKQILLDIGEYIVNKFNKPIKGEVLISAIKEVYTKTTNLSQEEIDKKIEEIIKVNKERQTKCFPPRYKVLPDGTKIPYQNMENKFDLETVDKKAI